MARYKSGEEARPGDVVECVDAMMCLENGKHYTVKALSEAGRVDMCDEMLQPNGWFSSRFKLVSRAPAPEPEQPAVKNGTYASGETPMEGDEVEAIETYGSFFKEGDRFVEVKFSSFGHITAEGMGGGFHAGRFKLIQRKQEQPTSEPLVKWPEERKQLAFSELSLNELFVFDGESGSDLYVRQKLSENTFATLSFHSRAMQGTIPTRPERHVRRLKMIQQPKFEVI